MEEGASCWTVWKVHMEGRLGKSPEKWMKFTASGEGPPRGVDVMLLHLEPVPPSCVILHPPSCPFPRNRQPLQPQSRIREKR